MVRYKTRMVQVDCPFCGYGYSMEEFRYSSGVKELWCGMWENSHPQACGGNWWDYLGHAFFDRDMAFEAAEMESLSPCRETFDHWAEVAVIRSFVKSPWKPFRGEIYPTLKGRTLFE